jgi:hypothetical protein
MTRSRSVVAVLLFLLFAQAAAGDCLRPAFELRTPPPPGHFDRTMVVDDFDGDGLDDAVFVRTHPDRYFLNTATFQRGMGDGLFATPVDIHTNTLTSAHRRWGIQHVVARDLNQDGHLDLLLLENLAYLVFLAGNGDGTFASPVSSPATTGELFAIADLTGDHVDDVAAFQYETGFSVVLFLGNLTGTFKETTKIPLPAPPRAIAAGDLDGDGANDIVAGYGEPSHVAVLFGNDDGTFDPAVPLANGGTSALKITLSDLENDGDLDIVAENEGGESNPMAVHLNRGGRTFDPVSIYDMPDPFTSLHKGTHSAVADVTADGKPDLLATNGSMVIIRPDLGDGTFDAYHFDFFPSSGRATAPIDTTDFDGDGRVDVIIGQNSFDGLRALRNRCGDVSIFATATPPADPAAHNVTVKVTTRGFIEDFLDLTPVAATGTVTILEGATVVATGALSNGDVTLNVRGLTRGAHMLVARYSGDDQYEPAQSADIIVRVPWPETPPPPRRRAVKR